MLASGFLFGKFWRKLSWEYRNDGLSLMSGADFQRAVGVDPEEVGRGGYTGHSGRYKGMTKKERVALLTRAGSRTNAMRRSRESSIRERHRGGSANGGPPGSERRGRKACSRHSTITFLKQLPAHEPLFLGTAPNRAVVVRSDAHGSRRRK